MFSLDKYNRKFKNKIDRFIMPYDIIPNSIAQAIKMNERVTSRRPRQDTQQKQDQQSYKLDQLVITGKEMQQSNTPNDTKGRVGISREVRTIKVIVNDPITESAAASQKDLEGKKTNKELTQLNLMKKESNTDKDERVDKSLQTPLPNTLEYYEQMIVNNPILYRKVMVAYRSSKRAVQKQQIQTKTIPKRRDTLHQFPKTSLKQTAQMIKSPLQQKKFVSFSLYREFIFTIAYSHKVIVTPPPDGQYKAFIGKGNNGLLVKALIKSRTWWSLRTFSEIDSCNLVWTEWKKNKVIDSLTPTQIITNKQQQKDKIKQTPTKLMLSKRDSLASATAVQKKAGHLKRILKQEDQLLSKIDKNPLNQAFFTFQPFQNQSSIPFSLPIQTPLPSSKIHNHVPGCLHLHSKKLLFLNLKKLYQKNNKDPFQILPLTFLIRNGLQDQEWSKFTKVYEQIAASKKGKNVWICKPGQNSNRGHGISVSSSISQIKSLAFKSSLTHSLIIQKYMENPYLYNRRKFDLRCYILLTYHNNILKGYWYESGYVRTTSREYTLKNLENKLIHLTNDAVQKKGQEYGKFQSCNKVGLEEMEKYVNESGGDWKSVWKGIKGIAFDLINSVAGKTNKDRKQHVFQLFGLDFMLDDKLKPYLIQANSNPCLEVDGNVLGRVIPTLIENTLRVAVDPFFPPPTNQSSKNSRFAPGHSFQLNKFQLIYDSLDYQPQCIEDCEEKDEEEEIDEGLEEAT